MRQILRCAVGLMTVVFVCVLVRAEDDKKDEQVTNPRYRGWAKFAPGSRVTIKEVTVFGDSSEDEKEVAYRLEKVTEKRAILHTSVIVRDTLSRIETAPTKVIYPAKVSKAELRAAVIEGSNKKGTDTLKVMGKELECTTFEITRKVKGGEVTSKIWRNATVPGGIVKQIRTTKEDGKLVATTTTTVLSYRVGPPAKATKDKKATDKKE